MPGNAFFCFENDVIGIVGTAADLLNLKQKKEVFLLERWDEQFLYQLRFGSGYELFHLDPAN